MNEIRELADSRPVSKRREHKKLIISGGWGDPASNRDSEKIHVISFAKIKDQTLCDRSLDRSVHHTLVGVSVITENALGTKP